MLIDSDTRRHARLVVNAYRGFMPPLAKFVAEGAVPDAGRWKELGLAVDRHPDCFATTLLCSALNTTFAGLLADTTAEERGAWVSFFIVLGVLVPPDDGPPPADPVPPAVPSSPHRGRKMSDPIDFTVVMNQRMREVAAVYSRAAEPLTAAAALGTAIDARLAGVFAAADRTTAALASCSQELHATVLRATEPAAAFGDRLAATLADVNDRIGRAVESATLTHRPVPTIPL